MIIQNLKPDSNHKSTIVKLISKSTDLYIASPFLMSDLNIFFSEINLDSLDSLTLLTTLNKKENHILSKVDSLDSMHKFFESNYPGVAINIIIDKYLHGKVYVFKNKNKYISGIITSANLTRPGLSKNNECGVQIKDAKVLDKLIKDIFSNPMCLSLDKDGLNKCVKDVRNFREKNPGSPASSEGPDLSHHLTATDDSMLDESLTYWLKPIGVSDNYIVEEPYVEERLHFSKRRPSGVSTGDIIICYAVGHGKLISVYEVLSEEPIRSSKEEIRNESWLERWPWYFEGKNLTPIYGSRWWEHDLFLTQIAGEYLSDFPSNNITLKKQTLGSLNYGADKLRLSKGFAKCLISNIQRHNR